MKYAILPLCWILLTACLVVETPSIPFPDREIVFERSEAVNSEWDPVLEQLGFVNADGSGLVVVETHKVIAKPTWSNDGQVIFGLSKYTCGYPAYWDNKERRYGICNRNLPCYFQIESTNNAENPYEVIINNISEIILMDLSECKETRRLVDLRALNRYSDNLYGISYYPPTQELLYGLALNATTFGDIQYQIVYLNLANGRQMPLPLEGIYPSWSPDGTIIAFLGLDGLYIARSDGSDVTQLVDQPMFDPYHVSLPIVPIPRWSPDGEWLVYHVCTDSLCKIENAEIYKVPVSGGKPERILIGGVYPSWRP
jgi:Tol biopolymer transport system component